MSTNGRKIVFVGVPMTGKDSAVIERAIQVTKKRYLDEKHLSAKEVLFIDNFDVEINLPEANLKSESLWYLGRALKRLAIADEAVFGEGWHLARGCITELDTCLKYGIPTYCVINQKKEDVNVFEEEIEKYMSKEAEEAEKFVHRIYTK